MKTLLLIALILPAVGYAQETADQPFKNANTIIVFTDAPDSVSYKVAGQTMAAKGMPIGTANRDFYTISTGKFSPPQYTFEMLVNVAVTEGRVVIRGDSWNMGTHFGIYSHKYRTVPVFAFNIINEYALSLAERLGGVIGYAKE